MIYGVTGEPGAGKSMRMVKQMVDDLVSGHAFVVTNEIIRMPQLRRYVCQLRDAKGIEEPFDLDENFKWLPPEDVYEFWRHRSGGLVLDGSPDRIADEENQRKRMPKEQFRQFMDDNFKKLLLDPKFQRPVHYYISETADYFDSQEWQTTGRAVKWYARKHRHLHDNVYFTAHNMDDVELRLRNLVSENIDMVNQSRMSIGLFKVRPVLKARHYFKMKGGNKTPFRTEILQIDAAGLGSCYNTSGALSVHAKPEANRNAGVLPWWSLWLAGGLAVAFVVSCFFALPWLGSKGAQKVVSKAFNVSPAKDLLPPAETPVLSRPDSLRSQNSPRGEDRDRAVNSLNDSSSKPVVVTGFVGSLSRGRYTVTLSDGRAFTEADGVVDGATRTHVTISGQKYFYARASLPLGSGDTPARPAAVERKETPFSPALNTPRDMGRPPSPSSEAARLQPESGSWVTGSDGVSRLREPQTLGPPLTTLRVR